MDQDSIQFFDGKAIIRVRDRICETPEEMLRSDMFRAVLKRCIRELTRRDSTLLQIFPNPQEIVEEDIQRLIDTAYYLLRIESNLVPKVVPGSEQFFRDRTLFNNFIEYLYNYWRNLQRLILCDSEGSRLDRRPYRTFNRTIETLTHVVRSTYRDVQENISGNHPRIYRQVRAGAEIATIALACELDYPASLAKKLNCMSIIRQVLIYPPLIFNPPMNKRTGTFERVYQNPLDDLNLKREDWLCYPAKVGPLLIMIYFSVKFFELGFAMANLFELADDADLQRRPDAIYLYGVPAEQFVSPVASETIFYEEEETGLLIAAVPDRDKFGYFGYLKKMVLTLHNIRMMRMGRMPFHGALVNLLVRDRGNVSVLIMGDTGAGKSETLEALRVIGSEDLQDITIVADDMGSLEILPNGQVVGYGTETGAFVRLDDLQPGYAFGQIDRTIIMSPNQTNARVVLPVTTYEAVMQGWPIDYVLYANNYETVDGEHPVIDRFDNADTALEVFRAGRVMSKGTTTTTGQVQTYFANIFGPDQYQSLHEQIARRFFDQWFANGTFVGQMRTELGIAGREHLGPEQAARELLARVQSDLPVKE